MEWIWQNFLGRALSLHCRANSVTSRKDLFSGPENSTFSHAFVCLFVFVFWLYAYIVWEFYMLCVSISTCVRYDTAHKDKETLDWGPWCRLHTAYLPEKKKTCSHVTCELATAERRMFSSIDVMARAAETSANSILLIYSVCFSLIT